MAADTFFLTYRRVDMFFVKHGFAIRMTGKAKLLWAGLQMNAAYDPVRPVAGVTLILGNRRMHYLCRFKLLGLFLVTVNTLLFDKPGDPFLTRSGSDKDYSQE